MAGPSWLAWTFAGAMIIVSAYCLTRLAASWRQHRPTDHRVDGIHVLMGVAMAGHARAAAARVLDRRLGGRLRRRRRLVRLAGHPRVPRPPTTGGRPGHHLQHLLACGAMLYMYLAVATVAKAAAGGSAMGGMAAGGAHFRTLALVLALALFGYVVWTVDRLSSLAPVAALAARSAPVPVLAGAVAGGGASLATGRRPPRTRAAKARAAPRVMTARRRRARTGRHRCPLAWPRAARSPWA